MNKKIIFILISTFGLFLLLSCGQKNSNNNSEEILEEVEIEKQVENIVDEKFLITRNSVGYFKIGNSWQDVAKIYNYKSKQSYGSCVDACCDGGFLLENKITIGAMLFDQAEDYEGNKYTSNPNDIPEGATKNIYEMIFVYKVNGEEKEFSTEDLSNVPEGAEFIERKDKLIEWIYPTLNKDVFYPAFSDYNRNCGGSWYWRDKIGYIVVHSDLFKTKEGIGVGTTLEEVQKKNGNLHFYVGWIEEDENALKIILKSYPNIEFVLDVDDYKGNCEEISLLRDENSLTISDFKRNSKIKHLIVNQIN